MEALPRRTMREEILLVLGVSLGASGVFALLDLIRALTVATPLNKQPPVTIVQSAAPDRPWLDLAIQLARIAFGLVPALLAVHLMRRDHDSPAAALGLVPARPWFDAGSGAGLAALIGLPGLGLYIVAHQFGANLTVVPEALPKVWWGIPVLLLAAAQNAVLEEVVVVGYLVTRLRQSGWGLPAVVAASAVLRGSYHLYQGFGGFLGNAVMGVIFALFFISFKRVGPLIIAHTILDTVAFVGYALLAHHLWFLH